MALLTRRGFLAGLAAPAIVHAGNLMPVKMLRGLRKPEYVFAKAYKLKAGVWREELVLVARECLVPGVHVQLVTADELLCVLGQSA